MRSRQGLLLLAAGLLIAGLIAVPAGIAPRNGSPDANIEAGNCSCHGTSATSDVKVLVDGPGTVVQGEDARYLVEILASSPVQYGFAADLDGKDLKGARLSADVDSTPTESNTHLTHTHPFDARSFNVTFHAPDKAGKIKLILLGLVTDGGGTSEGDRWGSWTQAIEVVTPRQINLTVEVRNPGAVEAKGVHVRFAYLLEGGGDVFIGDTTVAQLGPGEATNVSVVWNASLLAAGEYRVRVTLDPEDGIAELSHDNNAITKTVIIEPRPGETKEDVVDVAIRNRNVVIGFVIIIGFFVGIWGVIRFTR